MNAMTSATRRAVLIATCGVLLACEAPTLARPTAAYDPTSLTGGQIYRWQSGSTVRVWVVPPVDSVLDLRRATQYATNEWNNLPLLKEFHLEPASSMAEAHVVVLDRKSPLPVVPSTSCTFDPRSSMGYTYFCPQGNSAQRLAITGGGNSQVSVIIRVDVGAVANQNALETLLTHEFGHAVGIGGHSTNTGDVMHGAPTARVPSNRDAQTLQFLLGERPAFTL